MRNWYMKVNAGDSTQEAMFYSCDRNPIDNYPERFDHSFVDFPDGDDIFEYVERDAIPSEAVDKDDIRLVVDDLDPNTDYWIIDAHDQLGSYFPAVPDVPGYPRPTYFVGVPRDRVIDVYTK